MIFPVLLKYYTNYANIMSYLWVEWLIVVVSRGRSEMKLAKVEKC